MHIPRFPTLSITFLKNSHLAFSNTRFFSELGKCRNYLSSLHFSMVNYCPPLILLVVPGIFPDLEASRVQEAKRRSRAL
jgi:hypothetical protein